jgi:hypothetical protein
MKKIEIIKELGKPKIHKMMDENKYWSIIQDSIDNSNNQEEQEKWLIEELSELNLKEIICFHNRTNALLDKLDNGKMKCASVIINYSDTEDDFLYFRAWIISLGKEKYFEVYKNPDCLAKYVTNLESLGYMEFETFFYATYEAFESITNESIFDYLGSSENDILSSINLTWLFEHTDEIINICPNLFMMYKNINYKKREYMKELLELVAKNFLLKDISSN